MLISENMIKLNVCLNTKEEVIAYVAKIMTDVGKCSDEEKYEKDMKKRESEISTNLGDGIGMPHARTDSITEAGLVFLRLEKPINWGSENTPVRIVFGIGVPEKAGDLHLKILASLSRKLIYDDFRQKLFESQTESEILNNIKEATGGLL